MEFLGVGPLELFFILVLALIVLGPKDMIKTGRQLGSFLRKIIRTDTWQAIQQTSRDIRYLPNKLMRESGLDEEVDEIGKIGKDLEASAKEMQTSIKEMETSVKNEVDNAVKEMDVTVPVDDLEKTAQEIKKDLSNLASSQTEQSHTTITSPPPPVLDKTDQHSTENENVPPIDSADFEIDAKPISDTTAGLETTTSDASVVKNGTSDAPEIQQEDSPSELNKPQTETNIENQ